MKIYLVLLVLLQFSMVFADQSKLDGSNQNPQRQQRVYPEGDCQIDPAYDDVIQKAMSSFSTGIPPSMIQTAKVQRGTHTFTVRQKRVSFNGHQMRDTWKLFLLSLGPYLPDMEFVVNFYDQPRVLKGKCAPGEDWRKCACDKNFTIPKHGFFIKPCSWPLINYHVPIFSQGTVPECFSDILIPYSPHHFDPFVPIPWKERQFKAIWRGATTGGHYDGSYCQYIPWEPKQMPYNLFHRQRLVGLCSKLKDCDARFSTYSQCSSAICGQMLQEYGNPSCIAMRSQSINKLMIDIDGNTYSERFPRVLASGSVIMKIASFLDVGFVPAKPWVHYIPVNIDLSDFEERLNWARDNDQELQQISIRGQKLVKNTLQLKHYRCYTVRLLRKYASLFVSQQQYRLNQQNKNN